VPTSALTTGNNNAVMHRPLFKRHQVHFSLSRNASSRRYHDEFIKHVTDVFCLTPSVSSVCNNLLRTIHHHVLQAQLFELVLMLSDSKFCSVVGLILLILLKTSL